MTELQGLRFAIRSFDDPDRRGWGLRLTPTGELDHVRGSRATRQSVLLLLSTMPGERVMRPSYGCRLHELAFAPNNDTTAGLAMHFVRRAVEQWVPTAAVMAVDAFADPHEAGTLRIRLDYAHRPTGARDTVDIALALSADGGPDTAAGADR